MRVSGVYEVEVELPKHMTDDYPGNNVLTSNYEKPQSLPKQFILSIQTNNLGRAIENEFYISDVNGMVWYDKGEFKDSTNYRIAIDLSKGSYQFKFKDDMEDGISRHWWNRNAAPEQVGINGLVQIESTGGDTLVTFHADFGQEVLLNFIVE